MAKKRFDIKAWTKTLAECIEHELGNWRHRMTFDTIRALAIDCHPWHENALTISFLTDRELFDESQTGRWSMADWRMYNFTSGPSTNWPYAEELMRQAHEYYMEAAEDGNPEKARDQLVKSCATALLNKNVRKALAAYHLSKDFEFFAGHPDEPEKNYCKGT